MKSFSIFNGSVFRGLLVVVGLGSLASIAPSVSQARAKRTLRHRVAALETTVVAQGARIAKLEVAVNGLLGESSPRPGDSPVVGLLQSLVTAQSLFREGDKDKNGILDYSTSLSQLATLNLIDLNFASSPDENGYVFTILPSTNVQFQWSAVADPEMPGVTGNRHFFVNESGVIRYALGRSAGPADPPVD